MKKKGTRGPKKHMPHDLASQVRRFEREIIDDVIAKLGSRAAAAKALNISRQTLRLKLA